MNTRNVKRSFYKRLHDALTVIGITTILTLIFLNVRTPDWFNQIFSLGFLFSVEATWILYRKNGGEPSSWQSIVRASLIGICIIVIAIYSAIYQ